MLSKEELAQPVGNAKIRGEFDTDTATAVGPNANDAFLFQRSRSDHDGNMTGLSLAGTVLVRRCKILGMIDGHCFKAHDLALDQTVTVRQAMPTSPRDGDAWATVAFEQTNEPGLIVRLLAKIQRMRLPQEVVVLEKCNRLVGRSRLFVS